jgi:hypothetical protein
MSEQDAMTGRFAIRNRYAAECSQCSVLVIPDGGILRNDPLDGPIVWCMTCLALEYNPHAEIRPSTPFAAQVITIAVLGFPRECWRCGTEVTCVAGLFPYRPGIGYRKFVTTQDEPGTAMTVAARLLATIGRRDITTTIRPVYSRTLQATTIAVHCPQCRTMQGNYFTAEETMNRVLNAGIDGLDILGRSPSPTREWQQLVHDDQLAFMIIG